MLKAPQFITLKFLLKSVFFFLFFLTLKIYIRNIKNILDNNNGL